MRLATVCVILVLAAPAAALGQASGNPDPNGLIDHPAPPKFDASGTWQVEGRITARGSTIASTRLVCAFAQQNGALSGSCKGPNSLGPVQGIVFGKRVRWTWRSVPHTEKSPPGATMFNGELGSDGAIKGLWTFSGLPGLTGRFTQTRQKPATP